MTKNGNMEKLSTCNKKVSELERTTGFISRKMVKGKKDRRYQRNRGKFWEKLQEKVMILQLGTTQGINNVERCEA